MAGRDMETTGAGRALTTSAGVVTPPPASRRFLACFMTVFTACRKCPVVYPAARARRRDNARAWPRVGSPRAPDSGIDRTGLASIRRPSGPDRIDRSRSQSADAAATDAARRRQMKRRTVRRPRFRLLLEIRLWPAFADSAAFSVALITKLSVARPAISAPVSTPKLPAIVPPVCGFRIRVTRGISQAAVSEGRWPFEPRPSGGHIASRPAPLSVGAPGCQVPMGGVLHARGPTAASQFPAECYYKIINATSLLTAPRCIAGSNCDLISEMTGRSVAVRSFGRVRGAL